MTFRPSLLPLLAVLLLPLPLYAQQADIAVSSPTSTAEQDIGTLQAELAKVEAERQRLADELANAADHAEVERLSRQNLALRDRLAAMEEVAQQAQQEQQRKWFMVGGATVAGSLLLGWLLAQLGGRRKRNEWLN
ncbi:SH3 domain-containing protein [Pseudomonas saudimassiliensis]|uniref:SH3 domain-containing protein n=1 Tax=Pseudomonas saudimassiliensis TaxID=1461581 RepID=A0A078M2Q9_9PSED|nr:hypothetical protein [Pseudomonas saudimassiliensis]CEA01673.1 SH3 domain-containing protein [Pseudomonas saudimassiliensis]CEF25587.1 SH3 domain-containing protein [Pseudomonas saudimassiliensis]